MSFLSVLKKIAHVGEAIAPAAVPVVSAINPAAGAITGLVVNAVVSAEQAGGSGAQKRQQVVSAVAPLVSGIVQASGSKVNMDPNGVSQAVGQLTDGVVSLLNSMKTPASQTATAGNAAGPATPPAPPAA